MYKDYKIEAIFSDTLKTLVKEQLITMIKDAGQSVTTEDAEHLVNRSTYMLKNKFPLFTWGKVVSAWENGCLKNISGKSKYITVNNLISWLYMYRSNEQQLNRGSNNDYMYKQWDKVIEVINKNGFKDISIFQRLNPINFENNSLFLLCPTINDKDVIEENHLSVFKNAVKGVFGVKSKVFYVIK